VEIKVPHEVSVQALIGLGPVFLSYVISFLYVGIYWNNHHHLLQSVKVIDGSVLWANLFLLFWLSLIPFASGWMGENKFEGLTVTVYGVVLLGAALGYYVLTMSLLKRHREDSVIHIALGNTLKEHVSLFVYVMGLVGSFWFPRLAFALFSMVALMWLYPDKRIEKHYSDIERSSKGA